MRGDLFWDLRVLSTDSDAEINERRTEKMIEIGDDVYDLETVQKIMDRAIFSMALLVTGPPGVGKTHFFTRGYPVLLRQLFDVEFITILMQPHLVKNPSDLFEHPSVVQGNFMYVKGKAIELADAVTREGMACNFIVDEAFRVQPHHQNLYLDFTEAGRKRIFLQMNYEHIELQPYSKITLLSNRSGGGTFPINEAVLDRVYEIEWPAPPPEVAAEIAVRFHREHTMHQFGNRKVYKALETHHRELTLNASAAICRAAYSVMTMNGGEASLREIFKLTGEFISQPSNEACAKLILNRLKALCGEADALTGRKIGSLAQGLIHQLETRDQHACRTG